MYSISIKAVMKRVHFSDFYRERSVQLYREKAHRGEYRDSEFRLTFPEIDCDAERNGMKIGGRWLLSSAPS